MLLSSIKLLKNNKALNKKIQLNRKINNRVEKLKVIQQKSTVKILTAQQGGNNKWDQN